MNRLRTPQTITLTFLLIAAVLLTACVTTTPLAMTQAAAPKIVDIFTGDILGEIDLPAEYGLMPESVESAFGRGHDYHH